MIYLSDSAAKILNILTEGLSEIGDAKKIQNCNIFMPVHVDLIGSIPSGSIYSVAHYRKMNGDLICDPDMTFLCQVIEGKKTYSPMTFEMGGMKYERSIDINDDGTIGRVSRFRQQAQKEFAEMWMNNIKEQQSLRLEQTETV